MMTLSCVGYLSSVLIFRGHPFLLYFIPFLHPLRLLRFTLCFTGPPLIFNPPSFRDFPAHSVGLLSRPSPPTYLLSRLLEGLIFTLFSPFLFFFLSLSCRIQWR
jgi:hypothetical protein